MWREPPPPLSGSVHHGTRGRLLQGGQGEPSTEALAGKTRVSEASEAPEDAETGKTSHMGQGARALLCSRTHEPHQCGECTVRTLWGAGGEREPDDLDRTARGLREGWLLERCVRCKSHAQFGGGRVETGREAPRPVPTLRHFARYLYVF